MNASRAEICVVACAEVWRGDGEILASPFGVIPSIGAKLAQATFEPDLLLTDGQAMIVRDGAVEGWLPFASVFDLLAAGRRHIMMGAGQIDRHGNQNLSCIGPHHHPKVQLIGARGAPGNTVNHATSYWVPNHSPRVFVERVDFVSGVGTEHVRRVVTNLGVFDFANGNMRALSLHPGVRPDEVGAATGFALDIAGDVASTRPPTDEELHLIREDLDPRELRNTEVPP